MYFCVLYCETTFLQRLEDNIPGEMGRLLTAFCVQQVNEENEENE